MSGLQEPCWSRDHDQTFAACNTRTEQSRSTPAATSTSTLTDSGAMARLAKDRPSNSFDQLKDLNADQTGANDKANGLMLPPKKKKQLIPNKRSHEQLSNATPSDAGSSARKKRRRRRRSGRDGEGSVATRTTESSRSSPLIASRASEAALHPRLDELRKNTVKQQSTRHKEPELFGDYELSTPDVSELEEPTPTPKSKSAHNGLPPELSHPRFPTWVQPPIEVRPQIVSDVLPVNGPVSSSSNDNSVSRAKAARKKSAKAQPKSVGTIGKACPFRADASCDLRFKDIEAARLHAQSAHAALLICPVCSKKLSRKDKLQQHVETQHQDADATAGPEARRSGRRLPETQPTASERHSRPVLAPLSEMSDENSSDDQERFESVAALAPTTYVNSPVDDGGDIKVDDASSDPESTSDESKPATMARREGTETSMDEDESNSDLENKDRVAISVAKSLVNNAKLPLSDNGNRQLPFPTDKLRELVKDRSNGTKRKYNSSSATSSSKSSPSKKRARTEETVTTSEGGASLRSLPMRTASSHESPSTMDPDIGAEELVEESKDGLEDSEMRSESSSDDASTRASSADHDLPVEDGTPVSDEERNTAQNAVSEKSTGLPPLPKQQSSLDDYVVDAATLASSSHSGFKPIVINVPPVPENWLESDIDRAKALQTPSVERIPKKSRFKLKRDKAPADDRRCFRCWAKMGRCDNVRPRCAHCVRDKRNCQIYSMTREAYDEEKQRRVDVKAAKARGATMPGQSPQSQKSRKSEAKLDKSTLAEDEPDEEADDFRPRATTIARRGGRNAGGTDDSGDEGSTADDESDTPRTAKSGHSKSDYGFRELAKMGKTGRLDDKERRYLLAWRDSFCAENEISAYTFNEMMEASSKSRSQWPFAFITKNEFMDEYHNQLPGRNLRTMLRFREREFRNVERGGWSIDDEKELGRLIKQHGQKWVKIGEELGRTADEVSQRWRHIMNYGKGKTRGSWTDEELIQLEQEMETFAASKGTTVNDTSLKAIIPWHAISEKLGTGRTAQQCSMRWYGYGSSGKNSEVSSVRTPHSDRIPSSSIKMLKTPSKMEQRLSGQKKSSNTNERSKSKSTTSSRSSPSHVDASEADDEHEPVERQDEDVDMTDVVSEIEQPSQPVERNPEDEAMLDDGLEDTFETRSKLAERVSKAHRETKERAGKETTGSESDASVSANDIITVRQSTPLTSSDAKSTKSRRQAKSAHAMSSKSSKAKQKRTDRPTQSSTKSVESTQNTPIRSKNPLPQRAPASNEPSLTQAFVETQANSSQRTAGGRSVRSRVPDSIYERPSPNMSVRRRPQTSPPKHIDTESSDNDVQPVQNEHDIPKSPASFRSAQEHTQPVNGENKSEEATTTGDEDSDDDVLAERSSPAPRSSFWTAINSVVNKVLPGSQKAGVGSSQTPGRKSKGKSLANALDGVDDSDDSDEE